MERRSKSLYFGVGGNKSGKGVDTYKTNMILDTNAMAELKPDDQVESD